jgi:hypothetical protein
VILVSELLLANFGISWVLLMALAPLRNYSPWGIWRCDGCAATAAAPAHRAFDPMMAGADVAATVGRNHIGSHRTAPVSPCVRGRGGSEEEPGDAQQGLSCSVCLDLLLRPHRTPCSHIFCEGCVFTSALSQLARRVQPSCPLCRRSFRLAELVPDLDCQRQIDSFPSLHRLAAARAQQEDQREGANEQRLRWRYALAEERLSDRYWHIHPRQWALLVVSAVMALLVLTTWSPPSNGGVERSQRELIAELEAQQREQSLRLSSQRRVLAGGSTWTTQWLGTSNPEIRWIQPEVRAWQEQMEEEAMHVHNISTQLAVSSAIALCLIYTERMHRLCWHVHD